MRFRAAVLLLTSASSGWPALSAPDPSLAAFQVHRGFRVELVAAEPMVVAPVAMAFDENGRLFVAEIPDYHDRRDQTARLGRIRLLEDTDGDGVYDAGTIYADNLAWPSAVACYDGGIFVGATPEILYLKDSRGGSVADTRKVAFTGFGGAGKALDSEHLLNSLVWGPDNRIYGATAGLGGTVTAPDSPGASLLDLAGSDFSFDPRGRTMRAEVGPSQSGLTFDDSGRRFVSDFNRPLRLVMYAPRYTARNPFFAPQPPLLEVVKPSTDVFSFVPRSGQATRVRGTGLRRANGLSPVRISSRSPLIYAGSAFPSGYGGDLYLADPEAHVIHRERLLMAKNDSRVMSGRAPDEADTEFLVSRDPAFQPMQIVNGPDGAIYIADLHRATNAGRIYRIVPQNFQPVRMQQLGKSNTVELVGALGSANGWHRDTARRLLVERHDSAAARLVTNVLARSRIPAARLEALRTLDGLAALTEDLLLSALRDVDDRVRELAVRLCENRITNGAISDLLWGQLSGMTADAYVAVRYQLAFTLGQVSRPGRGRLLAEILTAAPDDPYVQTAALSSMSRGGGEMLNALAANAKWGPLSPRLESVRQAGIMVGLQGQEEEIGPALGFAVRPAMDPTVSLNLLGGIGEGLYRAGGSLAALDTRNQLARSYDQAYAAALDDATPLPLRVAALQLLGVSPYATAQAGEWLLPLVGYGTSEALSSAVITTLVRCDTNLSTILVGRWSGLAPALRREILTALLRRGDRLTIVLSGLESGRIPIGDLVPAQSWFLKTHPDPDIRRRALRSLGPLAVRRPAALERFKPALKLRGESGHGRQIYQSRCVACHELLGEGRSVGPDLDPCSTWPKPKLLQAILEPNAEVATGYTTQVAETHNGENFIGLVRDQNEFTFTLRQMNGQDVVLPRSTPMRAESWSLMPEGIEAGLSSQDVADLLEYLLEAR